MLRGSSEGLVLLKVDSGNKAVVGRKEGTLVGATEGNSLGLLGATEGNSLDLLGTTEGNALRLLLAALWLGIIEGDSVGSLLRLWLGTAEGDSVG